MPHLIYHAGSQGKGTKTSAAGMIRHTQRKKYDSHNHKNEDIDTSLTKYNMDFMTKEQNDNNMTAYDVLQERLDNDYQGKRKLRKDQVVLREIITQPSPEMFEGMSIKEKQDTIRDFVQDSIPWYNKEFGEDNVLGASAHLDETNPHVHVMIIPMTDDGRISQTDFFTGPKALKQQHQDYREHMIAKGWEFETENKYENIDNHEMPVFKANAKQIQSDRERQTELIRNASKQVDIRKEAIKEATTLAYHDVHEKVFDRLEREYEEERERLRKERLEFEKQREKFYDSQAALNEENNKEYLKIAQLKGSFTNAIADISEGYVSEKDTKGIRYIAETNQLLATDTMKSVLNVSVQTAIKRGTAQDLSKQSNAVASKEIEDDSPEL